MILDEVLRSHIDQVARRRKYAETQALGVYGVFWALLSYAIIRMVMGFSTGGQGGLVSFILALATGITYGLSAPRSHHTRLTAARFIDTQLHLDDRLATAVELADLNRSTHSLVEQWLFQDAANHAPFIHPEDLVPYRLPRQTRWLVPLIVLSVFLSLPIYPTGFSWQIGGATLQQAARRADELLALAEQLDHLATEQPQLRPVASQLRRVSELLRNKRIPRNEALQLLRDLEQEQIDIPGSTDDHPELDIAQIQRLAERLQRIEGQELLRASTSSPGGYGNPQSNENRRSSFDANRNSSTEYSSQNGQYPDDSDPHVSENASSSSGSTANNSNNTGPSPSQQNGSTNNPDTRFNSDSSYQDSQTSGAMGAHAEQADTRAGGSEAGFGAGNMEQRSLYQRQTNLDKELTPVLGQLGADGKLYTGSAQGNAIPGQMSTKRTIGSAPRITRQSVEKAIEQEQIPLAYRHWIKTYFEQLEPRSLR